eukprot:m.478421 g.478421  ORF g.478421 m.478421 type:complete len:168 (-) comp21141_c0_seq1:100-603(-)
MVSPPSGGSDDAGLSDGSGSSGPRAFTSRRPVMLLTRVEKFSAAHRLNSDKMTPEQNSDFFGPCQNIHGHNYKLEVTVKGKVREDTGAIVNCRDLKQFIHDAVIKNVDHKNLDEDVAFFKTCPSTTENLALYIWLQLEQVIPAGLLHEIKIFETDKNVVTFRGEFDE